MTIANAHRDEGDKERVAPGLWNAIKAAGSNWLAHKSPKAGASLAYYSVFSMGPLIVVVISIASLVLKREGVQGAVVDALTGLLGDKGGEAIASWNLGLRYEALGGLEKAIALMQVCVDFDRAIGHPDAEKRAAYVGKVRTRLKG